MKTFVIISVFSLLFINVVFGQCSNPNCGNDFAVCGNTAQLNVQNATTGFWTAYVGSVVLSPAPAFSPTSTSAIANVTLSGILNDNLIVNFVWTDYSGPCKDTVVVEFVETPVVNAGVDFDVCGPCGNLNCVSGGFGGTWLPAPGANFENYDNVNTQVCVSSYGVKTFTWLESNLASTTSLACSDLDELDITFWRQPTATILTDPSDTIVCGLSYEHLLADCPGNNSTCQWICVFCAPGSLPPIIPSITVPQPGMYDFYFVEYTGPFVLGPDWCADTAGPLTIHFLDEKPLFAGNDAYVFSLQYTLSASSEAENDPYSECIYQWENEYAFITNISELETSVVVPQYGQYDFVLNSYYENLAGCYDSDTVRITFFDPAYQNIENDLTTRLKIFPNPASDYVTIQTDKIINSAQIFDINGKLIKSVSDNFENIDISNFEQGLYFVLICTDDEVLTGKFVR
jgi:hypothetical protein